MAISQPFSKIETSGLEQKVYKIMCREYTRNHNLGPYIYKHNDLLILLHLDDILRDDRWSFFKVLVNHSLQYGYLFSPRSKRNINDLKRIGPYAYYRAAST